MRKSIGGRDPSRPHSRRGRLRVGSEGRLTGTVVRKGTGSRPGGVPLTGVKVLDAYQRKRRFGRTPEPPPRRRSSPSGHLFVVQKHRATQLHYDFRLEVDGVLKSWSVPKGPSLDPTVKRFAIAVEDHPLDYAEFEGVIPAGEYGGGTVMVWDHGGYEPEDAPDVAGALRRGRLKFILKGRKLKGAWVLVRTGGRRWLLFKHRDSFASLKDVAATAPRSVLSGRTLAWIAADEGGDVAKAATGDPPKAARGQ